MKVSAYKIVKAGAQGNIDETLGVAVAAAVADGYNLIIGQPFTDGHGWWYQAVAKED